MALIQTQRCLLSEARSLTGRSEAGNLHQTANSLRSIAFGHLHNIPTHVGPEQGFLTPVTEHCHGKVIA